MHFIYRVNRPRFCWLLIFFLTSVLLQSALYSNAQERNLYFENFKVKDGLPDNSVISITQDKSGYIWLVTKYGLSRYDGVNFKTYKHDESDKGSILSNETLSNIISDRQGRLWITSRQLELYHPENETFQKVPIGLVGTKRIYFDHQNRLYFGGLGGLKYFEAGNLNTAKAINLDIDKSTQVNIVYEDKSHHLWVGTSNGLYKIEVTGNQTHKFPKVTAAPFANVDITAIAQDKDQNIWIGTRTAGIYCCSSDLNHFAFYKKNKIADNGPIGNHIRKIMPAKDGTLWIGTQEGLSILNVDTRKFYNFQHDPTDQHSLSHNSIYDIFQDKAGSVWIGTYFGGLNVAHVRGTPFTVFQNNAYKSSLSSNIISAIAEDAHHNLWIGTEAGGLNLWNRRTGNFTVFKNDVNNKNTISSDLVKAIAMDKDGDVYIGTANGGLNIYHPSTGKFENYWYAQQKVAQGVGGDNVKCLLVTHQNQVLVGTSTGVKIFSKTNGRFTTSDTTVTGRIWVNSLYEDKYHTIWVGTNGGLYQMTASGQMKRTNFYDPSSHHNSFSFNVNCFQEDRSGRLWVGTYHKGLVLLDQVNNTYHVFTSSNGLPGNNIVGILSDLQNNLWISTDNGLSKFDVTHNRFQNLTVEDGLPDNQFNKGSYYKQNDSTFYFGTYNGLVSFDPRKITQNQTPPNVVFSYIKLFNQPLKIDQQHQLLNGDLNYEQRLTFKYDQNVFTIGFAALNFIKPTKNKYAYRLTGFDRDWNYVNLPAATYTNLPAGDYQLEVKAANNDGVWSQAPSTLHISVLPAPWKTWWAYTIYLIIIAVICFYVRRFLRARMQLRQQLFRERIEAEQEKRIHQQQLDFFTNVSHEIRTPLTLILGPLEGMDTGKMDNNQAQRFNSIKSNANRLYRLVTELLDFRKAGVGQLKLYIVEEDLIKFTREIFDDFKASAEIKGIDLQFNVQDRSLMVYFDRDQLEKVLNNLLINALKFTPQGGWARISVRTDEVNSQVKITVEDNGKGIQKKDLGHIFENFYQADLSVGTGIGLALSKRLVELHKGTISVSSQVAADGKDGLTTFTVTLKLGNEHFANEYVILRDPVSDDDTIYQHAEPAEEDAPEFESISSPNTDSHSILLVEDNDEVREFIKQSLEVNYQVIEAKNGQEGFNYATRLMPDLIISDVMMPVMDGLELCSKIKDDIRTSHIPVILLTARSAPIHHIDGLQHGADAYITKPFSPQVLNLNIHNMLKLISAQQQKYSERLNLGPLPVSHAASDDEKLLNKLQEIIQQKMANPNFDINTLAREIGMSRALMYRKFSALTNQSLNNFIKTERLKKAVELFKEGETSVIAVAVEIGFNDVKYFSKEFKKLYNVTPNEYLNGKN